MLNPDPNERYSAY